MHYGSINWCRFPKDTFGRLSVKTEVDFDEAGKDQNEILHQLSYVLFPFLKNQVRHTSVSERGLESGKRRKHLSVCNYGMYRAYLETTFP